ncbi:MAG: thiamine diphosphokinase [Lachnospiraceae bacterium]|nr:thiamine diphosphokinase [Lachnospiraceae bacterium]
MSDNKRDIIIVTGGSIDNLFAYRFLNKFENPYIIGVDRGLLFLKSAEVTPNEIMGDMDSVDHEEIKVFMENKDIIKRTFSSVKDETDTQLAISRATNLVEGNASFGEVHIIGGTGTRLDHVLAGIHGLTYAFDRGVNVYMYDPNNKIYLAPREYTIARTSQYGKYVSFLPVSEKVESLTLTGFRYNLKRYTLFIQKSLATSNMIVEEMATVKYRSGYLLAIESLD